MFNESYKALYEARLRDQLDQNSLLREAREAEKRGVLIGQIHLCQELLKQPVTPYRELVATPLEDLAALLAPLRKQALANSG